MKSKDFLFISTMVEHIEHDVLQMPSQQLMSCLSYGGRNRMQRDLVIFV